ncbi:SDR family oxidoreductase [bacterium]|nr:SDR family oxidoreductase [bacterium]
MATSLFNLEGKVALVTGGNGGIGLGMAEAMAEAGADVCIWGRNEEKNEAAAKKLKKYDRRVLALKCDVADEQQVEECFAKTVATLGMVTTCFANAAISPRTTPFHKMTIEEWRSVFNINMEGVFYTFRAAIRHMIDDKITGSLIATSSIAAVSGQPRGEHYASTKAGLTALIRSLSVEYARYNIRANAILPGFIDTEMIALEEADEKVKMAVMQRIPQRRWGVPKDFGPIAVYFASDASAYHTGDSVIIDGGYLRF